MRKILKYGLQRAAVSFISVFLYRIFVRVDKVLVGLSSITKARALFPRAKNLSLDLHTEIKYPQNVFLGENVIIGSGSVIGAMAPVYIGDYVRISRGVTIETATLDFSTPLPYCHTARRIQIGKGVWLGCGATILGGVMIGDFAVIGAGAVVSKNVPARAIIVGSGNRRIGNLKEL